MLLAASPHFDPSIVFRGFGARECGEANANPHLALAELYAGPHGDGNYT